MSFYKLTFIDHFDFMQLCLTDTKRIIRLNAISNCLQTAFFFTSERDRIKRTVNNLLKLTKEIKVYRGKKRLFDIIFIIYPN